MSKVPKRLPALVLVLAVVASACTTASRTTARSTTTSSPVTTTSPTTTSSTTTTLPTTTTTTTASPQPALPVGVPVPAGFEPGSVTFVSATTGFVIGIDSTCAAGSCVALARTTDGGAGWSLLPAPAAGYAARGIPGSSTVPAVSEVRFADARDGWIYGPSLFATHDGGADWQQVDLGGPVIDLEASGRYVDAVVSPCAGGQPCTGSLRLYQAPTTGGAFVPVLTGPSTRSSSGDRSVLSLHAPVGFVNPAGVAKPGAGTFFATANLANARGWKSFPDPCAASPDTFVGSFVAPDTTSLYTLCSGAGAAGSEGKAVVRTENGKSTVVGNPPFGGDAGQLAATSSGTLVVSASSGASWLYRSTDGGATWTTAETYSDGGVGFNDLGFTTSTQGVVIHGLPGPPANYASQLLMTHDGGASWTAVPIG